MAGEEPHAERAAQGGADRLARDQAGPDWRDESHSLALTARMLDGRVLIHVIVNAYWERSASSCRAPRACQGWRRVIDTYLESPHDICSAPEAPLVCADTYVAQPRSVVVLAAWA